MEFSIIIPVYNVENYITECVDSIVKANLHCTYEVLLIVGDSVDNSTSQCHLIAETVNEVRVIDQKGKGLSHARNLGLNESKGNFVTFIDSDDFVDSRVFFYAVNQALSKKVQVMLFNYEMVFSNTQSYYKHNDITSYCNGATGLNNVLDKYKCFWNSWRNIYNRDFLLENELYFKEGFLSEDIEHTTRTILTSDDYWCSPYCYYKYRINRNSSLMNTVSIKRISDTLCMITESIAIVEMSNSVYKDKMIDNYIFEWILNLSLIHAVEKGQQNKAFLFFQESATILEKASVRWLKQLCFIVNFFGIEIISTILFSIKKIKNMIKSIVRK